MSAAYTALIERLADRLWDQRQDVGSLTLTNDEIAIVLRAKAEEIAGLVSTSNVIRFAANYFDGVKDSDYDHRFAGAHFIGALRASAWYVAHEDVFSELKQLERENADCVALAGIGAPSRSLEVA